MGSRINRIVMIFIPVAVLVRVLFWVYTDRIFEDAMITLTYSKNVSLGLGLVHNSSARIQGFTSPIGVSLPVIGEIFGELNGVAVVRLFSVIACIISLLYADKIAFLLSFSKAAKSALFTYLSLDYLQIFYGMSGMETQIATMAVLICIHSLLSGKNNIFGLTVGLCLLVRLDLGILLFLCGTIYYKNFKLIKKAFNYAFLIYFPWLLFSFIYYKSVIPNTITAKANEYFWRNVVSINSVGALNNLLSEKLFKLTNTLFDLLNPFHQYRLFDIFLLGNFLILFFCLSLLVLFFLGFITQSGNKKVRALYILVFIYIAYWFVFISSGYYLWYIVPFFAIIWLFICFGIDRLRQTSKWASFIVAVGILYFLAVPIIYVFNIDKKVNERIEVGVRKQIGLYLNKNVDDGETILLEPLGYIGYYAGPNIRIVDYPGLVSAQSVFFLSNMQTGGDYVERMCALINKIDPDWIVFRPAELETCKKTYSKLLADYKIIKTFLSETRGVIDYYGVYTTTPDWAYHVLKRL